MLTTEFENTGNRMLMVQAISNMWLIEPTYAMATEQLILGMSAHDILEAKRATKLLAQNDNDNENESANNDRKPYSVKDGIAYISIEGPMTKKTTSMEAMMGGCSMVNVQKHIKMAVNDKSVDSIMMLFDSPGGSVDGAFDLAYTIHNANKIKPVDGYIQDNCNSAAYLCASQVRTLTANTNALVGSIGVIMGLVDSTGADKQRGIKRYYVKTGEHKGVGFPGAEVTESNITYLQERVDKVMGLFVKAVAKGRNMDLKALEKVTNAKVFVGNDAKRVGLIDGIMSADQAHANAISAPKKKYKGITMSEETTQIELSDTERWLTADTISPVTAVATATPVVTEQPSVITEATTAPSTPIGLSAEQTSLLSALNTAGITSKIQLDALVARADLGDEYLGRLRAQTDRLAIVALGPEVGAGMSASIALLGASELRSMAATFEQTAVAKGVIPPLAGNPAQRTSASGDHAQVGTTGTGKQGMVADTSTRIEKSPEERIAAARADLLANNSDLYHL